MVLREQVEELQLSLQREMDQHQRELTALQTLHAERLQALTRSHQQQVSQLQTQLQEMERNVERGREQGRHLVQAEGEYITDLDCVQLILITLNNLLQDYTE